MLSRSSRIARSGKTRRGWSTFGAIAATGSGWTVSRSPTSGNCHSALAAVVASAAPMPARSDVLRSRATPHLLGQVAEALADLGRRVVQDDRHAVGRRL